MIRMPVAADIALLVGLLAAVGLSAAVGCLDYVLLPALVVFVGITVYAVMRQRRGRDPGGGTSAS